MRSRMPLILALGVVLAGRAVLAGQLPTDPRDPALNQGPKPEATGQVVS